MVFNGWESLGRTLLTGILAYGCLILLLRISGKRTLSKLNGFDLVVTVALGSILATVSVSKNVALVEGVATMALLIASQFLLAWLSVRSETVRRVVRGEPTMLVYRGEYLRDAMHAQRVTESEIRQAARAQAVTDLGGSAVVLETDGSFSVLTVVDATTHSTLADFSIHQVSNEH